MKRKGKENDEEQAARGVKRERLNENAAAEEQDPASRRVIRSEFLKLKTLINGFFPTISLSHSILFSIYLNFKE